MGRSRPRLERLQEKNVYRGKKCLREFAGLGMRTPENPPCSEKAFGRAAQYRTEERLGAENTTGAWPKTSGEFRVSKDMEEAEAARQWLPFVACRNGTARHRTLFGSSAADKSKRQENYCPMESRSSIFWKQDNSYGRSDFDHLVDTAIPPEFWTMSGIDWVSNSLTAHGNCYCDVSMSVEALNELNFQVNAHPLM